MKEEIFDKQNNFKNILTLSLILLSQPLFVECLACTIFHLQGCSELRLLDKIT